MYYFNKYQIQFNLGKSNKAMMIGIDIKLPGNILNTDCVQQMPKVFCTRLIDFLKMDKKKYYLDMF